MTRLFRLSISTLLIFFSSLGAADDMHCLSVQDAEQLTLCSNKSVQQAELAFRRDYAVFWDSLSQYLPHISLHKEWGHSSSRPFNSVFLGRDVNYQSLIFQLDQVVMSLPTYYQARSSHASYLARFFEFQEICTATLAEIREAHYTLVANTMKLQIQQEIVDLLKESCENEMLRLEVGETTDYDYKRNLVAYNNALGTYYRQELDLELSKSRWVQILGIPPERGLKLQIAEAELSINDIPFIQKLRQRLPDLPQIQESLFSDKEKASWEGIACQSRPQLLQSEKEYVSAKHGEKAQAWRYSPDINFFANRNTNRPQEYFSTKKRYTEYGIRMSWSIFDGGNREAGWVQARREKELRYERLEELRQLTLLEVRDRREALQNSLYSFESARRAKEEAEGALAMAKELVNLGDLTALEYRDIVQSLGVAKQFFVDSQLNVLASYYRLLAAMGLQSHDTASSLLE